MKSLMWSLGLGVSCLFAGGCGQPAGTGEAQTSATDKREDEAARRVRAAALRDGGRTALADKRFDDAVTGFEAALALQDDPPTQDLLRDARRGREEARQAAYEQQMRRGEQAREQGSHGEARAAYQEALKSRPEDANALAALRAVEFLDFRERGRAALDRQRYADAVIALAEALERQPADSDIRNLLQEARLRRRQQALTRGRAALAAKQYPEAVKLFGEVRDLRADDEVAALLAEADFLARLQQARRRVETNQFASAISDLTAVVRDRPDHAEAQELLRKAREGKRRQDRAEYDRALAAGDAALARKDYAGAASAYRTALARQSGDARATSKLAEAENGRVRKEAYDRAMSQGKLQMTFKNPRIAEIHFQQALTQMPGDPEAFRQLQLARQTRR